MHLHIAKHKMISRRGRTGHRRSNNKFNKNDDDDKSMLKRNVDWSSNFHDLN